MKYNRGLRFSLSDLKKIIGKWLKLENEDVVDVIMATYVANRLDAEPAWLILIGSPSSAKTELLRGFDSHDKAYFLSSLTPSTLVSGQKRKAGSPDPSLLPKLSGKMLILKDFTSILSMRHEIRTEILAQLRECYDGSYSKTFGNNIEFNWTGRFGLLGACTPVYDNYHGVIATMGERFLLYRIGAGDGEEMGLRAISFVGQESQMRKEIRNAVHRFTAQFDELKSWPIKQSEVINSMIVNLACFCAYARTPVERDYRNQEVTYMPTPEGTPRLAKQFMQMAIALAYVHGKSEIDVECFETVKKIGRDLVPTMRIKVIEYLWNERAIEIMMNHRKTGEIAERTKLTQRSVVRNCEDLMLVGMLNRKREGDNSPYECQLTDKVAKYIEGADIFTQTE